MANNSLSDMISSHKVLSYLAVGCLAAVFAVVGLRANSGGSASTGPVDVQPVHPATGSVCGQRILHSPYTYDGVAGAYTSGTAGLPTYGQPQSDFPHATAGAVLPAGTHNYASYELRPNTVYYLLPGVHIGSIMADQGDAFVGGLTKERVPSVLSGNYSNLAWGIDSNSTNGNQPGVTIEYLTIEKYQPDANAGAINQDSNTGWTIQYNTITLNVPGAGVILGANNTLRYNCLTLNGQYGFQSEDTDSWGEDSMTGGPYNVTVTDNEISYNDTCDFEGLLNNAGVGWTGYNPVPSAYRSHYCGTVVPDGDQGGFKLWRTNGVTITGNYVHNNWGPGGWADTNNANTTYTGNTFAYNDGEAIIEEISYNFSITDNYMLDNGWVDGLANAGFPTPAVYISESGSDTTFGGVPACAEKTCADQKSYPDRSIIGKNVMVDNGGGVFLWQSSNRFCSDGSDAVCTLVGADSGQRFTMAECKANVPRAAISKSDYIGKSTGATQRDWWDGCLWKTENVSVTHNSIDFNPADVTDCNLTSWPACGANGIFSEYGSTVPYNLAVIPTQLTFFQHNTWSDNTYNGPSTFYAWNQGNGDNPLSWADWTGSVAGGDRCQSPGERASGGCTGPFGQDAGSTYNFAPFSGPAADP